jgi:ubiquinone/menaquinone biosynthesis C-methylase UbiE
MDAFDADVLIKVATRGHALGPRLRALFAADAGHKRVNLSTDWLPVAILWTGCGRTHRTATAREHERMDSLPSGTLDRDVDYLREVQYRDSTELAKRANLHVKYRSSPELAFDWLAKQVEWPSAGHVLDVGCGNGLLWETVAKVAPGRFWLTLVDLSQGMVDEAVRRALATGAFRDVAGYACDARELPFNDDSFDVVVSTYALYHVPEPDVAVAQIARVVTAHGTVAIMTNGPGHIGQIEALRIAVLGPNAAHAINRSFAPDYAAATLVRRFDDVAWRRFDDELAVTDIDDLLASATSSPPFPTAPQLSEMRAIAEATMLANGGVFTVSKNTGLLIARRPHRANLSSVSTNV